MDSVVFTLKYTVLATVLLIALGLGLALLVQESTRWKRPAARVVPRSRARSAWRRRRCCSTSSTRRWPARWRR